jgi:hypothetical protein
MMMSSARDKNRTQSQEEITRKSPPPRVSKAGRSPARFTGLSKRDEFCIRRTATEGWVPATAEKGEKGDRWIGK